MALGMTQSDVCGRTQGLVKLAALSAYERGYRTCPARLVPVLMHAIGGSVKVRWPKIRQA